MEDRKIGPLSVDVWSNPDMGSGSFFVILNPLPGPSVHADMKVQVAMKPVSKRQPEKICGAWREKFHDRVEWSHDATLVF